ncbi:MAG: GNAT family N-acetyltransferase [Chloroflexota bacterium]|mgnify:CR=1 FL=1|nr:GNAT family N-acetyltransferase [Chloroflexota bacterium]
MHIALAETDQVVARCHPVMVQLRPHLADVNEFVAQVKRQFAEGFRLAYVEDGDAVVAAAGFRVQEMLAHGRLLYVDDLVSDAALRSHGYGAALMAWLVAYAREQGCVSLQLDSGVQRYDAHRFYFSQRMHIASYHFALKGEVFAQRALHAAAGSSTSASTGR